MGLIRVLSPLLTLQTSIQNVILDYAVDSWHLSGSTPILRGPHPRSLGSSQKGSEATRLCTATPAFSTRLIKTSLGRCPADTALPSRGAVVGAAPDQTPHSRSISIRKCTQYPIKAGSLFKLIETVVLTFAYGLYCRKTEERLIENCTIFMNINQ